MSTRGNSTRLGFETVLLDGLAHDGGLYVPESWPELTINQQHDFANQPYTKIASTVMQPFIGSDIKPADFVQLVQEAYAGFSDPTIIPLRPLAPGQWLMEQFHGPTLAFKDIALQLLGRLFGYILQQRGERITIVGATSGDTGSAAIEACRDQQAIDIFMLFPRDRVSPVQRRQMTSVDAANVHCLEIDGTFDACQDLVKAMFADTKFRHELRLSAVNSINWARIMAQIVYYVAASARLGGPVRFAVPTGNFGNVYAGYVASRMGIPIEKLIVATNRNDIMARFFNQNDLSIAPVMQTSSPSMDIQVASNFERLLFDLVGRKSTFVTQLITDFRATGQMALAREYWQEARINFTGYRLDDGEVAATIKRVWTETGLLIDPHTAIAVAAAHKMSAETEDDIPYIALSTAHPAKFPDSVEAACRIRPALPERLADLFNRREYVTPLPNALDTVQTYIKQTLQAQGRL